MRIRLPVLLAILSAACSHEGNVVDQVGVRIVTFPNGETVRAEVMMTPDDLARGMMYRESLPRGRGMLFIHPQPGPVIYWMYRVRVPLDIVFMDASQRVVDIAANAKPCTSDPKECPQYGPDPPRAVQYVLELGGGEAARYGLKPGDLVRF